MTAARHVPYPETAVTADTEHATEKAIVQREYGPYEVLHLDGVDRPTVDDDEVLVRVHAAVVNHADWGITTGLPYLLRVVFGLRRPKVAIRCRDVAGTVEAVGSKVTRLRPGDEVHGEIDTGSFAEFTCAPERLLAIKPTNLTFEQAAVPVAAITALQGLRDVAGLRPGQPWRDPRAVVGQRQPAARTDRPDPPCARAVPVREPAAAQLRRVRRPRRPRGPHRPHRGRCGDASDRADLRHIDTPEAIRYFGEGHARAKLVIAV